MNNFNRIESTYLHETMRTLNELNEWQQKSTTDPRFFIKYQRKKTWNLDVKCSNTLESSQKKKRDIRKQLSMHFPLATDKSHKTLHFRPTKKLETSNWVTITKCSSIILFAIKPIKVGEIPFKEKSGSLESKEVQRIRVSYFRVWEKYAFSSFSEWHQKNPRYWRDSRDRGFLRWMTVDWCVFKQIKISHPDVGKRRRLSF